MKNRNSIYRNYRDYLEATKSNIAKLEELSKKYYGFNKLEEHNLEYLKAVAEQLYNTSKYGVDYIKEFN